MFVQQCFLVCAKIFRLYLNSLFFFYRHVASFLSMFKLLVIGVIIVGKDPFALFGMQAPAIWEWGQGNKVCFNLDLHQSSRCWSIFQSPPLDTQVFKPITKLWKCNIFACVEPHNLIPLFRFQIYACMMVFFLSNMIENQLMSTGAFEITLNGKSF